MNDILSLKDSEIAEMRKSFEERQVSLSTIIIQHKNGVIYIDGNCVEAIIQDDEYYDNIEDNIMYANLCWLNPLIKELKTNFLARINVLPNGEMDHQNIYLEFSMSLPQLYHDNQVHTIVYPLFKKFINFRSFIDRVEFKGHKHQLRHININLQLNGKDVNKIINTPGINNQVLSQWLATLDNVLTYNKDRYKYVNSIPVMNGKMMRSNFESTMSFKFGSQKGIGR